MSEAARPRFAAVVLAGGSSSRMGGDGNEKKEYRRLRDGRTVLATAVAAFLRPPVDIVVVVVPPEGEASARNALSDLLDDGAPGVPVIFVSGGSTRRRSVHNALKILSVYDPEYVLIHDGARPWVDAALIDRVIAAVVAHGAVVPVLPLVETPKELDPDGFVLRHLRRAAVVAAQTPQAFGFAGIREAHDRAEAEEFGPATPVDGPAPSGAPREYTDDAELWGAFVGAVATVAGSPENRKITFPEDLPPVAQDSGVAPAAGGRR